MKMFGFECVGERKSFGGMQWKFQFDNGWGASVINDGYGSEQGLFELAVISKEGGLSYTHPVSQGDVRGHLTKSEVKSLLKEIKDTHKF